MYLLASSTSNPIIGTKTENELFHHWAFYKPDRTAPIITLNGDSFINIDQYDTYEEQGAIAVDDIDGPVDVIITGQVNTNVPNIYTVLYTATDSAGNSAQIERNVNVRFRMTM